MNTGVEKDWITEAGFRAVVYLTSMGHRCGYVGVPPDHPLHGVTYSDDTPALTTPPDDTPVGKRSPIAILCAAGRDHIPNSPEMAFDVHGGITYSNEGDYPVESDLWWFGFDCAHSGDSPVQEFIGSLPARMRHLYIDGVARSLEYCEAECESLAKQIKELTIMVTE
jgi:hypothetical protein